MKFAELSGTMTLCSFNSTYNLLPNHDEKLPSVPHMLFGKRNTPTPPVANGILQPNFIRVSWIALGCNNTDGFCRLVIYHYNVANLERHTVYLNYLVISHPPSTLDCQCHAKCSGRISPVFKRRVNCNYWKSLLHNASVFGNNFGVERLGGVLSPIG